MPTAPIDTGPILIMTIKNSQNKVLVTELSLIEVSGADSAEFLHAQFTGNCTSLIENQMMITGWCSPKGRVLHLIRLIKSQNRILLLVPNNQIESIIKRLEMFVFRSKVTLRNCCESHSIIVCHGEGSRKSRVQDGNVTARFTDNQEWLVVQTNDQPTIWNSLDNEEGDGESLKLHDIRYGVPRLPDSLSDQFLPQEINLESLGGLSFEKGCYPGQEIIARVKYRGKIKRTLRRYAINTTNVIESASKLIDDDQNRVGTIIESIVITPDKQQLLAVVNVDCEQPVIAHLPTVQLTQLPISPI